MLMCCPQVCKHRRQPRAVGRPSPLVGMEQALANVARRGRAWAVTRLALCRSNAKRRARSFSSALTHAALKAEAIDDQAMAQHPVRRIQPSRRARSLIKPASLSLSISRLLQHPGQPGNDDFLPTFIDRAGNRPALVERHGRQLIHQLIDSSSRLT